MARTPVMLLHIGHAGPCLGNRTFLIIVNAHSKWLEVLESKITSGATIYGLSKIIVADNGQA